MSRSKIDALGERLRTLQPTDADLQLLDEWRLTFEPAQRRVMEILGGTGLNPTGRSMKSTLSIVEKLKRETSRLSQIQDIAGCRIIVSNMDAQRSIVGGLEPLLEPARVREVSSYGYRAVHLTTRIAGPIVEVQVRTVAQHAWADLSETLAMRFDPALKYGGGPKRHKEALQSSSEMLYDLERKEFSSNDRAEIMKSMYLKSQLVDLMRETVKLLNVQA